MWTITTNEPSRVILEADQVTIGQESYPQAILDKFGQPRHVWYVGCSRIRQGDVIPHVVAIFQK